MREVCVLGLGYIGFPTALMLAAHGNAVTGVDIDQNLLNQLQKGKITFEEDGLGELFKQATAKGITFQIDLPKVPIYIIAVSTPYDKNTKKIDPKYVITAVSNVLDICPAGAIIIVESTVSPGTLDKFVRPVIEKRGRGSDVHLVHAPERIIPGKMIKELRDNARTIGADSTAVAEIVRDMYKTFCTSEIVLTDIRTAEMTKVVENTYRDINIAFANELAKICRQDGLNVYEIIRISNMHPRVDILQPGPGVGGHCISVDPWFLVGDHPQLSLLIHEARKINDSMPSFVLQRIQDIKKENNMPQTAKVGFYGITYKEDVDDTRESPTMQLYDQMKLNLGGNSAIFYDPMCQCQVLPGQTDSFDTFLEASDLVVIMVGHTHIKENMGKLSGKLLLDTRNICHLKGTYKL